MNGVIADGSLCNGYIFIKRRRIRSNTVHIKVSVLKIWYNVYVAERFSGFVLTDR